MNAGKRGFSLVEMLVVIGIIAALSSAIIVSYGRVIKSATKAKTVELVSNARTALEEMHRNNDGWPQGIYKAEQDSGFYVMNEKIARLFAANHLLNVDYGNETLRGKDCCGIVDAWAQDVLKQSAAKSGKQVTDKKDGSKLLEATVPSGGKVRDHRLYFAVDQDDDGFVSKAEGAPGNSVRAKAIVWCAGADGDLKTEGDNIYSWRRAQEDRQ